MCIRDRYNVILALGIAFVPSYARVVRGEFARHREMNYVKSARLMGAGHLRIMFVHILPNTRQVILPTLVIGFNNAVLAEASMSYLGIGVKPVSYTHLPDPAPTEPTEPTAPENPAGGDTLD